MKNTKITTPPITTLVDQMLSPVGRSVLYVAFHSDVGSIAGTADWMLPASTGPRMTIATITSRPTKPAMIVFMGPADIPPPSFPPLRAIYLIHSHD